MTFLSLIKIAVALSFYLFYESPRHQPFGFESLLPAFKYMETEFGVNSEIYDYEERLERYKRMIPRSPNELRAYSCQGKQDYRPSARAPLSHRPQS